MSQANMNGIISIACKYSVDETVKRIEKLLQDRDITLFALIDHSGEAAKVGMTMPPTKLLIFGNPRAGTPVMQAAPSIAMDLPLKLLVAEDAQGKVSISWNDPAYFADASRSSCRTGSEHHCSRKIGRGRSAMKTIHSERSLLKEL